MERAKSRLADDVLHLFETAALWTIWNRRMFLYDVWYHNYVLTLFYPGGSGSVRVGFEPSLLPQDMLQSSPNSLTLYLRVCPTTVPKGFSLALIEKKLFDFSQSQWDHFTTRRKLFLLKYSKKQLLTTQLQTHFYCIKSTFLLKMNGST